MKVVPCASAVESRLNAEEGVYPNIAQVSGILLAEVKSSYRSLEWN
jgi:hypothetical protein